MEHLTKQQIVLLTLLVTFITSIATGVVTVTLLEKAPPGVTQVINRVVERTVEKIVPTTTGKATVVTERVIVKEDELIVQAVEKNIKSMVVWRGTGVSGEEVHAGLGFIISSDGLAVADKGTISWVPRESLVALYNGKRLPLEVVFEKAGYDFFIIRILQPKTSLAIETGSATTSDPSKTDTTVLFTPVSLADSDQIKLGQTVIFLSGKKGTTVSTSIVSDFVKKTLLNDTTKIEESYLSAIQTNLRLSPESAGAPLITTDGSVAGIMVANSSGFVSEAVPINDIKNVIPEITEVKTEDSKKKTE